MCSVNFMTICLVEFDISYVQVKHLVRVGMMRVWLKKITVAFKKRLEFILLETLTFMPAIHFPDRGDHGLVGTLFTLFCISLA